MPARCAFLGLICCRLFLAPTAFGQAPPSAAKNDIANDRLRTLAAFDAAFVEHAQTLVVAQPAQTKAARAQFVARASELLIGEWAVPMIVDHVGQATDDADRRAGKVRVAFKDIGKLTDVKSVWLGPAHVVLEIPREQLPSFKANQAVWLIGHPVVDTGEWNAGLREGVRTGKTPTVTLVPGAASRSIVPGPGPELGRYALNIALESPRLELREPEVAKLGSSLIQR